MIAIHLIGPYQFHTINGNPDFPEAMITGETRPGQNGATLYNIGVWGRLFQLETMRYLPNRGYALEELLNYKRASSLNPLPVVMGNITLRGGLFHVRSVEPLEVASIIWGHVPGDSYRYQGILRARWTLFPIAYG